MYSVYVSWDLSDKMASSMIKHAHEKYDFLNPQAFLFYTNEARGTCLSWDVSDNMGILV